MEILAFDTNMMNSVSEQFAPLVTSFSSVDATVFDSGGKTELHT
jgi:hypothetical protein